MSQEVQAEAQEKESSIRVTAFHVMKAQNPWVRKNLKKSSREQA